MSSDTRHVVITGASSGLGAALAQILTQRGSLLTLFGRDRVRLSTVAEACRASGASVRMVTCDVADSHVMEREILSADAERPVGLVIANAGMGGADVLAHHSGEAGALARRVINVNTLGVINTIAPLLDCFAARGSGHIVMVSSMAACHGLAEAPAYAASKAAVRIYGKGLRRLLAPQGIRVTVVLPGFIVTPMSASLPWSPIFAWSAERAARRIVEGIRRGESEILFPWQLRFMSAAAQLLPDAVLDRLINAGRNWMTR